MLQSQIDRIEFDVQTRFKIYTEAIYRDSFESFRILDASRNHMAPYSARLLKTAASWGGLGVVEYLLAEHPESQTAIDDAYLAAVEQEELKIADFLFPRLKITGKHTKYTYFFIKQ